MSHREGRNDRLVWVPDENDPSVGVFGEIIGVLGAFYTTIRYTSGGIEFEVLMENNEFELMEDLIEYDTDE